MTEREAPMSPADRERFDAGLADYLAGRLGADESAWFDAAAARDPAIAAELRADRAIRSALDERVRQFPADVGLEALMARVAADRPAGASARAPGPIARLARLFEALTGPRLALAMAAVIVLQVGILARVLLPSAPPAAQYRSLDASGPPPVHVRMIVASGVSEESLRRALTDSGAVIVWGPDELGEYWLRSERLAPEALAERLRAANIAATAVIDRGELPEAAR